MPSNQTPNYALNQWSKGDRVLMDDFNADNAKIDAAIKAEADVRETETSALASKLGNCKIVDCTRIGTGICGQDNPCQIDFNGVTPLMVVLIGSKSEIVAASANSSVNPYFKGSLNFRWSAAGLTWFCHGTEPENQFNTQNRTYHYFMIYPAE